MAGTKRTVARASADLLARSLASALAMSVFVGTTCAMVRAGPPFVTDDPVPTEYRSWEIYTGAAYENDGSGNVDLSLPFAELNYGALPNVQASVSLPLSDLDPASGLRRYESGGADVGVKVRVVRESANRPQISFYPSVELPTGGVGHAVTFLPIWLQKSWNSWTAFGGGGVFIHPGASERDTTFAGGALEHAISPGTTIGVELFHQGSQSLATPGSTGMRIGTIVQVGADHAVLFSLGRGLSSDRPFASYASYEFQLGPRERDVIGVRDGS